MLFSNSMLFYKLNALLKAQSSYTNSMLFSKRSALLKAPYSLANLKLFHILNALTHAQCSFKSSKLLHKLNSLSQAQRSFKTSELFHNLQCSFFQQYSRTYQPQKSMVFQPISPQVFHHGVTVRTFFNLLKLNNYTFSLLISLVT